MDWGIVVGVVGVVIAIFAIFIPIIVGRREKNKSLSYARSGDSDLINIGALDPGRLQVFFDGKQVERPHLTTLIIKNTGSVPISTQDFEEPVAIELKPGTTVLSVSKLEANPSIVDPTWIINESAIIVEPLLLNAGDSIKIAMITDGFSDIRVVGRIVGIKEIAETDELALEPPRRIIKPVWLVIMGVTGTILIGIALILFPYLAELPFILLFLFGLLLVSFALIIVIAEMQTKLLRVFLRERRPARKSS